MKKTIINIILIFISIDSYSQNLTLESWERESKTDKKLLPKYGHKPKTEREKQIDRDFVNSILKMEQFEGDRLKASNHLITLGFDYLYRGDLKTAMYRFNQAYLLDSNNVDIYWGFGAFFATIRHYPMAIKVYDEGLSIDSTSTNILTDYGTLFLAQYYENEKHIFLIKAIEYLTKSYLHDPKKPNTTFKLSVCYWLDGDCENAWRYYNECKKLGGDPITKEFTKDLKAKCKKRK